MKPSKLLKNVNLPLNQELNFTIFVRYIYLEEMEEDILQEEVVAFLELGEKYEVGKLKELAEEKMLQLLERETMMKFFIAGDLFR